MPLALAYIDPGSGAMLVQIVAASVAGALFFLRRLRRRLVGAITRDRPRT